MNVRIEEVSPQLAAEWLALSKGNRRQDDRYVLSLALAMESGAWVPEASEVVFDEAGALIDGHHRLSAVVVYAKPVRVAVKRGVPAEARKVIDTGRTRAVSDLLHMYRPGTGYVAMRKAVLGSCLEMLFSRGGGRRPPVRTLDEYDGWMRPFKEGVDGVVSIIQDGGHAHAARLAFRTGPVAGAFAFAWKTAPERVAALLAESLAGVGMQANAPMLTLRNWVLVRNRLGSAHGKRDTALKVLAALSYGLRGEPLARLQASTTALEFFLRPYDTRAILKAMDAWGGAQAGAPEVSP